MHASIWRFVGDPDELTRSYDQLVAEFPTDGFVAHLCLRGGIARREVGPHVIAADDAEDLHFTGAGRRQPRIRIVAHPAFGQHEGSRRRHQTARAALVFANCAPAHVGRACKIAANDLAGAEVRDGFELPPGTDETRK